ncbi:TetR/AcrR family transcriptional regulator [Thalassiella azotivora]
METDRRRQIARAALEVLAADGARGLTHRAVDRAADLPAGSTSYYFRSRAALLEACLDDLVRQDEDDIAVLAPLLRAGDEETFADAMAGVLHRWLTTERSRQLGRYELFLEALRRPDLATALHVGGAGIRQGVGRVLADLGAPDPQQRAEWLVAAVDGLLFERVAGAKATEPVDRASLDAVARWLTRAALR